MTLLATVKSPEDLKRLRRDQLADLAQEIRDRLIECCSITGGHIGASLGVPAMTAHRALTVSEDGPKRLHRGGSRPGTSSRWD